MLAKYPGKCSKCLGPIAAGDEITWNRKRKGQVVHISCPAFNIPTPKYKFNSQELDAMCSCGCTWGTHLGNNTCAVCDCQQFTPQSNGTDETNTNTTEGFKLPADIRNKIERIKAKRALYSWMSLKEAKDSVEAEMKAESEGYDTFKDRPTTKPLAATDRGTNSNDLASIIAQAVASYLPSNSSTVDADQVREIVKAEMAGVIFPTRIEITHPNSEEVKDMGIQHKQFATLLKVIGSRLNVWLAGPAGSGKTTAVHNVATALDLPFRFCGAQSNEYGLLGFISANGQVVRTQFREAYEHGGVFLFDEVDASSPAALLAFNAALANGVCAFPDVVVSRHTDFIAVAAANTFGLGGTNDYVGRAKQDAAFLDRFVYLTWEVDEILERSTVGNDRWVTRVQHIRAKVHQKGLKVLITPRASYYGAKLLASGLPQADVETMVLRKGMDDSQWASVN